MQMLKIFHSYFPTASIVLFLVVSCACCYALRENKQECRLIEDKYLKLQKTHQREKKRSQFLADYSHHLQKDPIFQEKVLRERLGYSLKNEIVYSFEHYND